MGIQERRPLCCSNVPSNVKICSAISSKENTSVPSIALSFPMPLQEETLFHLFFFQRTVFTLEGTLCHSENKLFDLLYKHNSISHTSVCVSVFVSLLQSSFISSKEKRDMSVDNIKQTKRGKNENHWVLCSSHSAPTERSLTAAELFHVLSLCLSLSDFLSCHSLSLSLSGCHG